MKKQLALITAVTLLTAFNAALAQVGYVDYVKIQQNYSLAKKYNGDLTTKAKEINSYKTAQEKAIKEAKTPADREKIRKESIKQLQNKNREWATLKNKYEKELTSNVKAASEKVRLNNGYDLILKSNEVITGGVDCTDEVLKLLK